VTHQSIGATAPSHQEGPLRVTNPEPRDPLVATIIKAAGQVGIRHNPDYNGAGQEGIAIRRHASVRRLTWECPIGAFAHGLAAGGSVTGWLHVTCAAYDSSPRRDW
jgi:choline dehydrogenase-like flavoprotein